MEPPGARPLDRSRAHPSLSSMEEENLREKRRTALLKECRRLLHKHLEHQDGRISRDVFRLFFRTKEFLELLYQLFDQEGTQSLDQDDWIEFLKARLSDEKQLDFAELVESVAYVECGEEPITLEHFCSIFNAKGICEKLFRLLDVGNVGSLSAEQVMEFVDAVTNERPRAGFDKESVEALERLFRQTVGDEQEIKLQDFQKIVMSKNQFFTKRVFQIFDRDGSGSISLQEFLDAVHQFAGQSPDDKIRFLFKVYDIDGDGLIQYRELHDVMSACMDENGMEFSEDQIGDLTRAMFEDADTENRGAITYEALKHQLEKHGGLLENLTISIDRWLVPPSKKRGETRSAARRLLALRPYQLTRPYWRNNRAYLAFLAVYLALNLALFGARVHQFTSAGASLYLTAARACGQCLNLNCALVLVLMLRQSITFLRTRGAGAFLPLDHHIYLHKLVGTAVAGLAAAHTLAHVCNFSLAVPLGRFSLAEWFFTARPRAFGLVPGWANPTGWLLCLALAVMVICSQPFVRRRGSFEVFYFTHLLYVPFWLLLVLHAPNFWKWFVAPGLVFVGERVYRLAGMRGRRGKTYISSGLLMPSRVTHLSIKRPLNFHFHAGDYVFVNIPAIAKYEWHPFTISSAPELEDSMWLHIRGVGEWTNRLYDYFEHEQERLHSGEVPPLADHNRSIAAPDGTLRRLQASLRRQFSRRADDAAAGGAQLVAFSRSPAHRQSVSASDGQINERAAALHTARPPPDKRLRALLLQQKVPLEKSLSMPDIQTKSKKKERLLALREYMRSESERSFDECQIRRARLQSLGLAYLSPQNKSLAQSFRYMRNKPTIIAFKTPSLENCDARISSTSLGVGAGASAPPTDPERQAEEGRLPPFAASTSASDIQLKPMNYPVGKPLKQRGGKEAESGNGDRHELTEPLLPFRNRKITMQREIEIYLDGPYGAPSSHIFQAQHAVLIATGIGVTPFASILQSIMLRYWKARHQCPACKHVWASDIPPAVMNLKKVDFFWINRNQRSFEWFVNLLSQLEIEQAELGNAMERFLEMHMYITSALQKTDMKAVGLQLALDLLHERGKRDLVTGLKTRTNAGRPNWDKVFKQIRDQNKGKVTVFYCGKPQAGRVVRYKCDQYGFQFRKENF